MFTMNKFAVRSSQFLICLMFYFSLNAQWTCDFDSQNWIEPELNNSNFNTETLQHTFMVLYHIVRMSNGTGGTTLSLLPTVHAKLNSNYNPFKIYFTQLSDVD